MNWWKGREKRIKLKRWGWYFVLFKGAQFKVKFLYFKKNGEISLQKHDRRSEVWCFLFGEGYMMNYAMCQTMKYVRKGQCEYVPTNNWHFYKAYKPTLVLEIQRGDCYEEDITRESFN